MLQETGRVMTGWTVFALLGDGSDEPTSVQGGTGEANIARLTFICYIFASGNIVTLESVHPMGKEH